MTQPPYPLPVRAGIGLRSAHCVEFLEAQPPVAFIEVHSENYFGRGGRPLHLLDRARRDYPLSLHGVGLSIGSVDPLNDAHLQRLGELVDRFEPALVSDHLCWSSVGGTYANDLLPLPQTRQALAHVVARVQQVQDRLRRTILLENISSYAEFAHSEMPESAFLAEVAQRSGCGILLDVNNIHVGACNHGFDAEQYLQAIPHTAVREIHLAGFVRNTVEAGVEILIDSHSAPVSDVVWELYGLALHRFGALPTLIEWDADLPPLATLVGEAMKADFLLERFDARAA